MANEYKIRLGVDLDTSDLKKQIDSVDNKHKIKLGVDLGVNDIRKRISEYNKNANNAKLKLGVKVDVDDIKKQIKNLKIDGMGSGKGIAIPIDTQSLESSLREVKNTIADIKTALGTLDGNNTKSLVASVNQIAAALDRATDESNGLLKSLNDLSKKDFNVNIGLDMGKKSNNMVAYGRAARKQVIPELELQISELENLLGGQQAAMKKLSTQGRNLGFDIFTDFADFNSDSAIKRMEAMEKYINTLRKLASMDDNINLGDFDNVHKNASELINSVAGLDNAVDKAGDVPEKLKTLFGSSIDGDNLAKQLDSIVTDLNEIKIAFQGLSSGVSLDGLTRSFDRLSETLEQLMTNAKLAQDVLGKTTATGGMTNQEKAAKETVKAYQEVGNEARKLDNISIDISGGNIDDLKAALKNLKVDDDSIEKATSELKEMNFVAEKVSTTLKDGNLAKIEIKGVETTVDGLKRAVTVATTFGDKVTSSSKKSSQALNEIAEAARKIKLDVNTGNFDKGIQNVKSKYKSLSQELQSSVKSYDEFKRKIKEVDAAIASNEDKALVEAMKDYKVALKTVNNELDEYIAKQKENAATQKLIDDRKTFQNKIDAWLTKNSKAAKEYGATLLDLKAKAESCDRTTLDHLEREFKKVDKAAEAAGKKAMTVGDRLKTQFAKYSTYFSAASAFMYIEQGLRSMFEQVVAIDSAMTELMKVTNETDAAYSEFLTNASAKASEIGTTIDGLVSSTAGFARLGYDFSEAVNLAEVANIYAVVGDEIESVEAATQSLISTMAAFGEETDAMSVIDKFNEIGNNFAISSGGVGEALQRSVSSLFAANNSLDESIALITAANTVVQDPDVVGTALKTVSMRVRGAKTE